jgi:hypothetical protein
MLQWRAISAVARLACPEALYGVQYTPDEVGDAPEVEAQTRRTVTSETFHPAADVGPTVNDDEPVEATVEPDETGEAITDHTRRKMFALLKDVGEDDPDKQRAGMSRILGREVTSRADLTEAEAQQVCDSLRAFLTTRDAEAVQRGDA